MRLLGDDGIDDRSGREQSNRRGDGVGWRWGQGRELGGRRRNPGLGRRDGQRRRVKRRRGRNRRNHRLDGRERRRDRLCWRVTGGWWLGGTGGTTGLGAAGPEQRARAARARLGARQVRKREAAVVVEVRRAQRDPSGTLAGTPPMGWNSWNAFDCNINEAKD